jgi:hypothetical protein
MFMTDEVTSSQHHSTARVGRLFNKMESLIARESKRNGGGLPVHEIVLAALSIIGVAMNSVDCPECEMRLIGVIREYLALDDHEREAKERLDAEGSGSHAIH